MSVILIPWADAPEFEQQIQLDGVSYNLLFKYNTESETWQMDIYTINKDLIVLGIRLVKGIVLNEIYLDIRMPQGKFVAIGDGAPDINNFGSNVNLAYISAS